MVGCRGFTESRKLREWLSDSVSFTLRTSSGTDFHSFQSALEASNPLRSTQTQPLLPTHLVPLRMSECPPAMIIVTPLGYFRMIRYLVQVFQTASSGGKSPLPSISIGPVLSKSRPQ